MCFSWRLTPGFGYLLLCMQLCYWAWNVTKVYYWDELTALVTDVTGGGTAAAAAAPTR